jgi:hypothetical protein
MTEMREKIARAIWCARQDAPRQDYALKMRLSWDEATRATDAVLALIEPVMEERRFVWKWIERAMFDKTIRTADALSMLAHYPGAPWNEGRWDVDHKTYAEAFYKQFPKARATLSPNEKHDA